MQKKGAPKEFYFLRDENNHLLTNVEHRVKRHSPSGLEIGYGGSGPADTAYNILLYFLPEEEVEDYYQDFKRDVICDLENGNILYSKDIEKWIKEKRRQ